MCWIGLERQIIVIPANDHTIDYHELVRRGYDTCAELYAEARRKDDSGQLDQLMPLLAEGSEVLDLGCGGGVPIALNLSARHRVTGVDSSESMLRLAEASVPDGRFILRDIMDIHFDEGSFDAVVAIFVLFHLPREEHFEVFRRVYSWLRPEGYFLATLTEYPEAPYTENDFFGVKMFWSNWGWPEYEEALIDTGFELLEGRIIGHGYGRDHKTRDERHPMMLSRKVLR